MVEVVLRSDVSKYKPKFMFGMTMRGALTLALCLIAVAVEAYVLYGCLALPFDAAGYAIVATTAAIAALGMGTKDEIHLTKILAPTLRHALRPECTEHIPPELVIREHVPCEGDVAAADTAVGNHEPTVSKAEAKQARRERRQARRETELCDERGECLRPKAAAKARGVAPAKKGKREKGGSE